MVFSTSGDGYLEKVAEVVQGRFRAQEAPCQHRADVFTHGVEMSHETVWNLKHIPHEHIGFIISTKNCQINTFYRNKNQQTKTNHRYLPTTHRSPTYVILTNQQPTYLQPAFLPTYLPIYLPAIYLPPTNQLPTIYLSTDQLPTYQLPTYQPTKQLASYNRLSYQLPTYLPAIYLSPADQLPTLPTYYQLPSYHIPTDQLPAYYLLTSYLPNCQPNRRVRRYCYVIRDEPSCVVSSASKQTSNWMLQPAIKQTNKQTINRASDKNKKQTQPRVAEDSRFL